MRPCTFILTVLIVGTTLIASDNVLYANSSFTNNYEDVAIPDETKFQCYMAKAKESWNEYDYENASKYYEVAKRYAVNRCEEDSAIFLKEKSMRCRSNFDSASTYYYNDDWKLANYFSGLVLKDHHENRHCKYWYERSYQKMHEFDNNMVAIHDGKYQIGRNDGLPIECPAHTVVLKAFSIMKTEVSYSMYCQFLNENGNYGEDGHSMLVDYKNVHCHLKSDDGIFFEVEPGYEDYPVVCVTFEGAWAFAGWCNMEIPTEEQFEAAFGDGKKKSSIDDGKLHKVTDGVPNEYGIKNLDGNVAEWTDNPCLPYPTGKNNKKKNAIDLLIFNKTVRGGAYNSPAVINAKTYRRGEESNRHYPNIGFRCVKNSR